MTTSVYTEIDRVLRDFDDQAGYPLNRVFYLSTAPQFFPLICAKLGAAGLHRCERAETRIVIEKPFGFDLASARELNECVLDVFQESQVFRIDHYLGKETVQNLMALRFANALFEPVWNRNFIDHVQITAAEEIGIEGRAGYYERAGALRDLVQNHMLQLLALLAMEPPAAFEAERVRNEKMKVLEAIVPPASRTSARCPFGHSTAPESSEGSRSPGTAQEEGVAPDSRTETYAALRLHVSNWRWAGVPFYLRTGKRLTRKLTEIAVTLKPVPHLAFQPPGSEGVRPNQIVLSLQPDEGVSVSLGAKIPGPQMRIHPVNMEFRYGTSFVSPVPGGVRAPGPRRDARRRDPVHAQRRGRGAMGDRRPDPHSLARGHHVADPAVPGGVGGTVRGERPARRRTAVAADLSSPPQVIVLGPPGAGKGTQAARLAEHLGLVHISPGGILRDEAETDSESARRIRAIMAAGELVPEEVIDRVVRERLEALSDEEGFVIDGYPRTASEARSLRRVAGADRTARASPARLLARGSP